MEMSPWLVPVISIDMSALKLSSWPVFSAAFPSTCAAVSLRFSPASPPLSPAPPRQPVSDRARPVASATPVTKRRIIVRRLLGLLAARLRVQPAIRAGSSSDAAEPLPVHMADDLSVAAGQRTERKLPDLVGGRRIDGERLAVVAVQDGHRAGVAPVAVHLRHELAGQVLPVDPHVE